MGYDEGMTTNENSNTEQQTEEQRLAAAQVQAADEARIRADEAAEQAGKAPERTLHADDRPENLFGHKASDGISQAGRHVVSGLRADGEIAEDDRDDRQNDTVSTREEKDAAERRIDAQSGQSKSQPVQRTKK